MMMFRCQVRWKEFLSKKEAKQNELALFHMKSIHSNGICVFLMFMNPPKRYFRMKYEEQVSETESSRKLV